MRLSCSVRYFNVSYIDPTCTNIANAKVSDVVQVSPKSAVVSSGISWYTFCAADGVVNVWVPNVITVAIAVWNLVFKVIVTN